MVGVDNNAFYNSEPMTNGGGRGVAPVKLEMTEVENRKDPKNICVLGSGDFGRAFAARAVACGFRVQIGTRSLQKAGNLIKLIDATGAALSLQQKAVNSSDVIIIAVGRDFFSTLPIENLKGKILVDVSNATPSQIKKSLLSNAEYLQQLIPSAQVVKAFNVVSAYLLETGGIQGSKEVPVASDSQSAQARVNQIVRDMGFSPVDMGPLRAAREIEKMPLEFFRDWYGASIVVGVIFVIGYIINIVKFQLCANLTENESWDWSPYKQILMTNFNRNLGVVALIVLGATYLPGVIAGFVQLFRGTKYKRFPRWLDRWLRMRKQLGLIMLAMAATHGCISLGVYGPDHQYDWLFEGPKIVRAQVKFNDTAYSTEDMAVWKHEPSWRGELFLTCGAVSLCLLVMLGISSLPSVTALLTWREFSFVQSKLGWAALVAASIHDGVLGGEFMLFSYKCYMPTGLQMALYLPILCVLGKLLLLLPPINRRLEKIRAGWTGKSSSNV